MNTIPYSFLVQWRHLASSLQEFKIKHHIKLMLQGKLDYYTGKKLAVFVWFKLWRGFKILKKITNAYSRSKNFNAVIGTPVQPIPAESKIKLRILQVFSFPLKD